MPKGFGVGLRVATIPIAGVEPLSPEHDASAPPSGGGGTLPGSGGGASGGLGGIGLIGLLLLALGIGIPAIVASPDDQQAQVQPQVQPGDGDLTTSKVRLGSFVAE